MPPKGKEPKKTKKQIRQEQEAERQRLAAIEEQERKFECISLSAFEQWSPTQMRLCAGLEREERERQEYEANAESLWNI